MKPRIMKAVAASALLAGGLAILAPAGCFAISSGLEPPLNQFYYPTALFASPGRRALYVVNSDFDIQYTGGTVQAVDLVSVRRCVERLGNNLASGTSAAAACADVNLPENQDPVVYPGPCGPIDVSGPIACMFNSNPPVSVPGPLIKTARVISAFASSATLVQNPAYRGGVTDETPSSFLDQQQPTARLFVSVRGDPSVTYFNVADDSVLDLRTGSAPGALFEANPFLLDCFSDTAQDGERCGAQSRIGDDPATSQRALTLPVEPVGIAASDNSQALVTVHEIGGNASLIFNDWGTPAPLTATLEYIASGLPDGPSDIAGVPTPALIPALRAAGETIDYRPGFLVTFRAAREVDMLRFYDDSKGTSRHFLQRVASFPIVTNSDGSDSRGIAVDDSERRKCEAGCAEAIDCLRTCLDTPLDVFAVNRAPASLLVGKLHTTLIESAGTVTGVSEIVNLNDMVPLSAGASRVALGHVLDKEGQPSLRAFVVSFDSRFLAIYNPKERRIEATVRTGRGPHAMAFDVAGDSAGGTGHAFLYVAHFTDSYLGAVDLDTRHARTYGSMIATIGTPTPPKDSN